MKLSETEEDIQQNSKKKWKNALGFHFHEANQMNFLKHPRQIMILHCTIYQIQGVVDGADEG